MEKLLSRKEIANILGVSISTLKRRINNKYGNVRFFDQNDLISIKELVKNPPKKPKSITNH